MKLPAKLVIALLCCAMPAFGQYYGGGSYGGPPSTPSTPSPMDQARPSASAQSFPWAKSQALLETLASEVQSGGIMAVAPHVDEMEQALTNPQLTYSASGTDYVLTDGPAETLMAMIMQKVQNKSENAVAMRNPYPLLSLYLGSYYNEIGKPDQAVRALDNGLKLSSIANSRLGATVPNLIAERGAALAGLKRWDDEVANADDGLKIKGVSDNLRALLYRGRGFALTELNRLDEAEAAYQESLKLQPGNARAEHELQYIAGLRAGAKPTPGGITPLQPPSAPTTK